MPTSSQDKIQTLLVKILENVRSTQERIVQIERDIKLHTISLRGDALAAGYSPVIDLAFRHAAAIIAAVSAPQNISLGGNRRLAQIFRFGSTDAISAEPELTEATEVLDLAKDYVAAISTVNSAEAVRVISAVRSLLADQIAKGVWLVLKPVFKQEYDRFKRDYLERGRTGAPK